jgi:hypothetical protein
MLANLKIKGKYKIPIANNKIKIGEESLSLKEIPFIRYDFGSYGEDEVDYIKYMREKFISSVPLVEFQLSDNILSEIELFDEDTIKYVYTNITDEDIDNGTLGEWRLNLFVDIMEKEYINSIVLVDNTTKLTRPHIIKFKKEIMDYCKSFNSFSSDYIAVCNSPFSFGDDACLSAIKARQLLSEYSEKDECAIPSARHECMECCGCMRHLIVDKDIVAVSTKKVTSKAPKENKECQSKTSKTKSVKAGVQMIEW